MNQQQLDTAGKRPRRARGSLSAEQILRGAFGFVEAESVDALSMPRLGQHLGVGVTSIYWYYKSKEELLNAMTAAALDRFYGLLPELPGLTWDEHLKEFFRASRRIYRENPVLCDLVVMRNSNFTFESVRSTWDRIESLIKVLVDAGFSSADAAEAYFALSVYMRGCVMIERMTKAISGRTELLSMQDMLRQDIADRDRYPLLYEVSTHHPFSMVRDEDFEFGLENAVAGLRARLG